jgi:hypothetical protein
MNGSHANGIKPINSAGRRNENNRDYIRWCFSDAEMAELFRRELTE